MYTISTLAAEFDMQPYELRAWADDLLDGVTDDQSVIPSAIEAGLRAAFEADGFNLYVVLCRSDAPLVVGERATGTSEIYYARNDVFKGRSTWDGIYAGTQVQEEDEFDPNLDADGTPTGPVTIHLFTDGHISGRPQPHHGFPVSQYVGLTN